MQPTESGVQALSDKDQFKTALGKENEYPNFLAFFQNEINSSGLEHVLQKYLFCGDDRAEDMLARLFGGECATYVSQFRTMEC